MRLQHLKNWVQQDPDPHQQNELAGLMRHGWFRVLWAVTRFPRRHFFSLMAMLAAIFLLIALLATTGFGRS